MQVHWVWLLVAFSLGTCFGVLISCLLCAAGSGDYYPSIADNDTDPEV